MKNSPDRTPLDELEKRIASYAETPDDLVWENIDAALRKNRVFTGLSWVDRATSATVLLVLLTTFLNNPLHDKIEGRLPDADQIEKRERKDSNIAEQKSQDAETFENLNQQQFGQRKGHNTNNSATSGDRKINLSVIKLSGHKDVPDSSFHPDDQGTVNTQSKSILNNALVNDSLKVIKSMSSETVNAEAATVASKMRLPLKRLRFYANVTPMLTFQRVIPAAMDGIAITDFDNASILAADRFAVSLSAGIQGYLSRRFEYYGGLTVYHQKKSLRYAYRSGGATVETEDELKYVITPNYSTRVLNYRMLNVGVQAGILYHLYGKRLSHKIGAGLAFVQGISKRGNGEVYENSGSGYLSCQLFYRNEMIVSRRLTLFLQPTFTQSIYVDENLDAPFKLKPYSAGIGVGLLYNLR